MNIPVLITNDINILKYGGAISGPFSCIREKINLPKDTRLTKYLVVISDRLVNRLNNEELKSIYYHEVGHIVLGHVYKTSVVVLSKRNELEADEFSAKRTSPHILLSALMKLPDIVTEAGILLKPVNDKRTDDQFLNDLKKQIISIKSDMQYRYRVLMEKIISSE